MEHNPEHSSPNLGLGIRRHGWIVLVLALLGAGYRYYEVMREPVTFESQAKMYVSGRVILAETPTTYSEELANYLGTQIEIMRSQEIRHRSLQRLALDGITQNHDAQLLIEVATGTTVLELHCESGDAEYARRYLDALMTEFIRFKRDRRLEVSENTVEQISAEIGRLESDLKQQEDAFFRFREQNNIGFWEQQSAASAAFLNELKSREADLRLQLSLMDNWRRLTENHDLSPQARARVPGINPEGENRAVATDLAQTRSELNRLRVEREMRLRVLQPAHPIVQKIDRDIERLELIEQAANTELLRAQEERRLALSSEIASVQEAIAEWETRALESSRIEAAYQKLSDSRDRTKDLYDRMLGSLRSIDVGKSVDQELIQVLQPASEAAPRPPAYRTAVTHGLFTGGLLGAILLWLIIRTDDRTYTLETAVDELSCKALGEVPLLSRRTISAKRARYEKGAFDESIRKIRSLLMLNAPESQTLLVTSSLASEGKTEIAVQLGRAFASAGKRVLLVDADLRRGRMDRIFGVDTNASPGFSGYLREGRSPPEVILETDMSNLLLVPRGDESRDAGELFSKSGVQQRLAELQVGFDVLIIDSAPIGPVDDTTWLLPIADRVIFVLRAHSTSLRAARENIGRLRDNGVREMQLLLNGVRPRITSKYYNYYR